MHHRKIIGLKLKNWVLGMPTLLHCLYVGLNIDRKGPALVWKETLGTSQIWGCLYYSSPPCFHSCRDSIQRHYRPKMLLEHSHYSLHCPGELSRKIGVPETCEKCILRLSPEQTCKATSQNRLGKGIMFELIQRCKSEGLEENSADWGWQDTDSAV